ncbi:MAG: hypothetical protein WBA39_12040, partial [Rivularia sp. (in: cyanobacteria)]
PTPDTALLENATPINLNQLNKSSSQKTTIQRKIIKENIEPIDLSEAIAKTDVEMDRLGFTPQQGREYLIENYGKRGRTLLTEEELVDFLQYLESIPTPLLLETDPLAGF